MSDEFELRTAVSESEIIAPHDLLRTCGQFMHDQLGLAHWHPFINFSAFKTLMKNKELYSAHQHGNIIATFNLSLIPRDYYFDELWSNPSDKAIYLGQLGIKPTIQGNGIGKWCMQQVEKIARDKGIHTIRFDALNSHPWLNRFYEKLGYQSRGIVKPGQWELMCYEKIEGSNHEYRYPYRTDSIG